MAEQQNVKNCAHNLEKPAQERQSRQFVGLRNKGATCYLNSLIQAYYATPEFRQAIFDMQLCVDNISKKSNFVEKASKHNFLLAFQKLFVEMQELNVSHMSTEDVTKSFGWDSNEALQQQDIQEAISQLFSLTKGTRNDFKISNQYLKNRVIFDGLEKALKGTAFQDKLFENFKIETVDKIKCLKCGNSSERINIQYDLMTQIKGQSCLEESLINLQNFEKLNGDNKYFCENCGSKQDALKGTQVRKLPHILTISLMRFEFDTVKLQRNKLNDRFTFGLELDASLFSDQFIERYENQNGNVQDSIYELYSVLIHKGGAHNGHYHTYVRDFSEKSDWVNPQLRKDFNQEDPNQMCDGSRQMEIESTGENQTQTNGKNGHNSQATNGTKSMKRNTRRTNKSTDQQEEEEFPIPLENQHLLENWFDVDDETIKCISGNKIQKQFGSNSDKESAYILLYRKKTLPQLPLRIPNYFEEHIATINNINQSERIHYENERNSIELLFRSYENLDLRTFKFHENAESTKRFKISKNQKINEMYECMNLNEEHSLFEVAYCENQMIQIYQEIKYDQEKKVVEADLEHLSEIVFIHKENNQVDYNKLLKYCGKENSPMTIKIIKNGEVKGDIIFHTHRTLRDFKQTLLHLYEVPCNKQYLKVVNGGVTTQIGNLPQTEEQIVMDLGILNDCTVILSELDDNEMIQEGQLLEDQKYIILEIGKGQPKKYVINVNDSLGKIKNQFIESANLDQPSAWRFKNVDENNIYKLEDYEQSFKDLFKNINSQDEIRLYLEEGPIPNKDEVIITFKFFDDNFQEDVIREVLANSNSTIKEVKDKACQLLDLNPQEYYVYKVDENEQPATCVKREGQVLSSTNLRKCVLFYLISVLQNIGVSEQEYVLYYYPDDNQANSQYIGNMLINKNLTLEEIKEQICQNDKLKEFTVNAIDKLDKENIRLREMKRNHQMGLILKKSDKKFGKIVGGSVEVLCIQIKGQKEVLEEDDIVLQVKKRLVDTQSYSEGQEFIFKAGKAPTINDLKREIINQYNLNVTEDEIDLAKHYITQFEWKEINLKTIQKYRETQQKAVSKKKGKKKKVPSQKGSVSNQNQSQSQQQLTQKENENTAGILNNHKTIQINQYKFKKIIEIQEDLKRMPYLLKDGDEIGYRLKSDNVEGKDDLQTEQDKENKKLYQIKKKNRDQWQTANFDDDKGFVLNLNFEDDEEDENFMQEEKDDSNE